MTLFKETGFLIKNIKELKYKNVRFLYKEGVDNNLLCFFSSFSKKGEKQSYNYLKAINDYPDSSFIFILDTDSPSEDPRGTYFLGDDSHSYLDNIQDIIKKLQEDHPNISNLLYLGSSKGATGALLVGLKLGKGKVVVNAPQVRIGDYLNSRNPAAVNYLNITIDELNNIIINNFSFEPNDLEIILTCGVNDELHLYSHLKYLLDNVDLSRYPISFIPLRGAHDGEVLDDYKKVINRVMLGDSIKSIKKDSKKNVGLYHDFIVSNGLKNIDYLDVEFFNEVVLKILEENISYIIKDDKNEFIKIKGLYGFFVNVYTYNKNGRVVAKSANYKNKNQTFHLIKNLNTQVTFIKVFLKLKKDILVFKVDIANTNLVDISKFIDVIQDDILLKPQLNRSLLSNLDHIRRDATGNEIYKLYTGKLTYQYNINDLKFIFFAHMKEKNKELTIMLPGAVNRNKNIYNFQRYSWSQDIDGSVISFLDPTVEESNELTIGWFQGNEKKYAIPVLVKLIKDLLIANNIKESNLTLFGSSAGGFSSLKIADEFPNSRVMVINPQTRIFNYSYKEYQKIVNWVFPDLTPEKAKDIHKDRLKIELDTENRKSPILYYQNVDDGHHLRHHLKPLLESLNEQEYEIVDGLNKAFSTDKNLKVIYYSDPKSGHSPLTKEDTVSILNREY